MDKKSTIMVIEDEELLQEAISKKLQLSGLHVISCTSGKDALKKLMNIPTPPNAIWLDYYLKDMNGLEFMQELKKSPKLANIPVIVVSNSASLQKVNSMLALGAKQYLLKAEHRLDDIITTITAFITNESNEPKDDLPVRHV